MSQRSTSVPRQEVVDRDFHNIRELLEMLMSELAPTKHKMKTRPNLGWAPPTDVYETETEFVTTVDIAGIHVLAVALPHYSRPLASSKDLCWNRT